MNKFLICFKKIKKLLSGHLELLFWLSALALLFFMEHEPDTPSMCFFRWFGINSCPGCGLGHSINSALHLHFVQSFKEHPLGIIAIFIILNRAKQLFIIPKPKLQYDK